jgi:hypothetical protein
MIHWSKEDRSDQRIEFCRWWIKHRHMASGDSYEGRLCAAAVPFAMLSAGQRLAAGAHLRRSRAMPDRERGGVKSHYAFESAGRPGSGGVQSQRGLCKAEERMNIRLTDGLIGDLVAPDGDIVPVYRPLDSTLEIREVELDVWCGDVG